VALEAPPPSLVSAVERVIPGIYRAFLVRLFTGIRDSHGEVQASSWWRSAADNLRVGGNARSQHLLGLAVDLEAVEPGLLLMELNAQGLTVIDEGDHLHVQTFPSGTF